MATARKSGSKKKTAAKTRPSKKKTSKKKTSKKVSVGSKVKTDLPPPTPAEGDEGNDQSDPVEKKKGEPDSTGKPWCFGQTDQLDEGEVCTECDHLDDCAAEVALTNVPLDEPDDDDETEGTSEPVESEEKKPIRRSRPKKTVLDAPAPGNGARVVLIQGRSDTPAGVGVRFQAGVPVLLNDPAKIDILRGNPRYSVVEATPTKK